MTSPRLSDVVGVLHDLYPPGTAQDWDAVGLAAGDPDAPVAKILFAVDPVETVVDEALEWGADLLLTHHPLFLRGVHGVAATTAKGALVHRLIRGGCGLYVAHTDADAAPGGVADALAEVLGVENRVPLVPGDDPDRGIGRVGALAEPTSLASFARRAARVLPATTQGVRVAGDPDALVSTVAVVGGAGDSLFDAVRASGADVYVTGDLRHHPASELRERAAHDGRASGGAATPYLVDVAHFAGEWTWLAAAASTVAHRLAGTVETRVSTRCTDPWTFQIPSSDAPDREDHP
ncbi:dinuclear metal center protein, YbgI/SA1388 family [Paraoerskovia marina]|uniref:GTP cyclohydrolase 1 type 2 homolog n=1 Tax=Paraoerskovia marina TaxID=545619 RepID=A0A1H1S1D7_9CELL|nr:Nif3-like dinuclear metal center hexameric protein [Paraoerskovia marina]SDS41787.1 dinuclear metal center protein, YbgI/SA1388 family [Paraoerskovia marina]